MYSRVRFALLVLAPSLLSAAAQAGAPPFDPADPPQGVFIDEWYVVELQGQKAGHSHSTVTRDGKRITTCVDMTIAIKRDDAQVVVEVQQVFREYLDGTPVGFTTVTKLGAVPTETKGKIRGDRVRLRESQLGRVKTSEHDFDPEAKLAWAMYLDQQQRDLKPGLTYTIKTYEPSLRRDGGIPVRVEVLARETIDLYGRKTNAIKVRQTMLLGDSSEAAAGIGQEMTTVSWLDDYGNVLRMDTEIGGMMKIRLLKSSRLVALADVDPPELFLSTFIRVEGDLDPRAERIAYRLRVTGDAGLPTLPDTGMQRFVRENQKTGRLVVTRSVGNPSVEPGAPTPAAAERYGESSLYADGQDPRIQALATKASAGASTPAETVDRLRHFVSDYIREKNLNVGFATASEVAQSREGDCTEHAVLLAAMARAVGIPARGVAGIVKVPGVDRPPYVFGYHMWTQVFVGGSWVDVDAALAQTECDPTHIALTILDLDGSSLAESSLGILPLLGVLEIQVESE